MSSRTIVETISERRSQSLSALVRDEIERQILGGEIAAGDRLNELTIATRLGVSRGPVREAVRLLERDGLVTSIVNHGAFVRQVSIEEAAELYDLRAVIMGHVCGSLAGTIFPAGLEALQELVQRMDEAAALADANSYYAHNLAFHDCIMELADRPRSVALYRTLVKEAHLFRRRSLLTETAMHESNVEHRRITEALHRTDGPSARQAAELHHFNGKRRWLKTME